MKNNLLNHTPDNRSRLLEAAESLFAGKGYAATSVREILREAGVTGPTLYYYFGSKEDLLMTLLAERMQQFLDDTEVELEKYATLESALAHYAETIFEGLRSRSTTVRFIFTILVGPQASLPTDRLKAWKLKFFKWLPRFIASRTDGVTDERITFTTLLFNGMITVFVLQFLAGLVTRLDRAIAESIAARAIAILNDELPIPVLQLSPELAAIEGVP